MQSTDNMKLRGTFCDSITGALVDFVQGEIVSAGRIGRATKRAELAVRHANVRGIDVAIDVEIRDVAVLLLAHVIREPADGEQIMRLIQRKPVFGMQALAREHLLSHGLQARVTDSQ